jgi:hypothetical protein
MQFGAIHRGNPVLRPAEKNAPPVTATGAQGGRAADHPDANPVSKPILANAVPPPNARVQPAPADLDAQDRAECVRQWEDLCEAYARLTRAKRAFSAADLSGCFVGKARKGVSRASGDYARMRQLLMAQWSAIAKAGRSHVLPRSCGLMIRISALHRLADSPLDHMLELAELVTQISSDRHLLRKILDSRSVWGSDFEQLEEDLLSGNLPAGQAAFIIGGSRSVRPGPGEAPQVWEPRHVNPHTGKVYTERVTPLLREPELHIRSFPHSAPSAKTRRAYYLHEFNSPRA